MAAQGANQDPQGRPDSYYEPQAPRYQHGTNDLGVLALGTGLGVGALGVATYMADPNGDSVFSMLRNRFAGERGPEAAAAAQAAEAGMAAPGPGEEVPAQAAQAADSTPQRTPLTPEVVPAQNPGADPGAAPTAQATQAETRQRIQGLNPPPGIPLGEATRQSRDNQAAFDAAVATMADRLGAQVSTTQPPAGGVRPVNLPGQPEAAGAPIGHAGLEAEKAAKRGTWAQVAGAIGGLVGDGAQAALGRRGK